MNQVKEKYLIVFSARTGSNLLRSLLNSHPQIVCDAELFLGNERFDYGDDPYRHIENSMLLNGNKTAYGFMVSLYQIKQMKPIISAGQFLADMRNKGWKIIYLYRLNVARQALSFLKARKTNIYHLVEGREVPEERISVSLAEVFNTTYTFRYYRQREERLLKHVPHLRIEYTQDLFDAQGQQRTVNSISSYLHLDMAAVSTDSMRSSGDNLDEDIINGQHFLSAAKTYALLINPVVKLSEAAHFYLEK